jgi:hypothetical protein
MGVSTATVKTAVSKRFDEFIRLSGQTFVIKPK